MIYRSLYFLFRDERTVRDLIGKLEERFALDDTQLHAIIESDHKLTELPGATAHKKTLKAMRREKNFLYLSVAVFTLALIALVLSLLAGSWYLSALFGLLVVGAQLSGYLLGNRIPNAQLDRFRTGLSQGDIVLQVDVPPGQSKEVKAFIEERIPDARTGVSNWHVGTIGL
jgi:hypothetical protein